MNPTPKRRGRPPKTMSMLKPIDTLVSEMSAALDNQASSRQVGGTHYANKTIQPWGAMKEWMSKEEFVGYLRGNAIKYLARCNEKGGVEDIKKARHYLDKLIEVLDDR